MQPLLTAAEAVIYHLILALVPGVDRDLAAAHAHVLAVGVGTLAGDEASQDEVWANLDVSLAQLSAGELPSVGRVVGL